MVEFSALEKPYQQYQDLLNKYFPTMPFWNTGYAGNQFNGSLYEHNIAYKDSIYYYTGEKRFIHWTNLSSLLSMINSKEIRLYNLLNSNDEREFYSAGEELGVNPLYIEHAKANSYVFSFCEKNELNNAKIWNEYGRKYEGVAIEFSIQGDVDEWKKYMLSKMQYGTPDSFRQFASELELLRNTYNISTDRLNMDRIIGFYKDDLYSEEKEVRLIAFNPLEGDDYIFKRNMDFKIDKANNTSKISNYITIPLYTEKRSWGRSEYIEPDKQVPQIKFEKIYIGEKSLPRDVFFNHRSALINHIGFKLNLQVEIDINPFSSTT